MVKDTEWRTSNTFKMTITICTAIHGREKLTDLFILYHTALLKELYRRNGNNVHVYFKIALSRDDPQANSNSVLLNNLHTIDTKLVNNNPIGNKWNEAIKYACNDIAVPIHRGHTYKLPGNYTLILGSDDFVKIDFFDDLINNHESYYTSPCVYPGNFICTDLNKSCLIQNDKTNMYFGSGRISESLYLKEIFNKIGYVINPGLDIGLDTSFKNNFRKEFGDGCYTINSKQTVYSLKKDTCLNSVDKLIKANPDWEAGTKPVLEEFEKSFPFLLEENHEIAKQQARSFFNKTS